MVNISEYITKSGLDITFSLKEALKKVVLGNALSEDPNSAKLADFAYATPPTSGISSTSTTISAN